jgi:hypothetical protein
MIEARFARSPAANATIQPLTRGSTYRHAAVWSLRALLAVAIFAWFAVAPPRAPQMAMMLELGRRAVVEHSFEFGWLGASFAYLVYATADFGGMAALGGTLVVVTLALVEFRARPRTGEVLSLAAMILCSFCFLDALRVGGGAVHWICAAALLLVLERARGAYLYAAIPIALIWANLAPDAIFAPAIAALIALGRVLDRRLPRAEILHAWAVTLGCAAVLLLTPAGAKYLTLAPLAAHLDRSLTAVIPLAPSSVAPHAYAAFFLILAIGAALGMQRCRWEDRLLFAAAIVLAFWNGDDLPLVGIVAAPVLVGTVVRVAPQFFAPPAPRERLADGLIALIALFLAFGFAAETQARIARSSAERDPADAIVRRAAADGRPHRLVCVVVEWCNYAIAFGNVRVLMDGRTERYDGPTRDAQHEIARVTAGWKAELARRGVDAVLAHRSDALAALLELAPGWNAVDLRDGIILFERERQVSFAR